MPSAYFRFKQFTVRHDLCAMKVGTDGVLLGSWTDCSQAQTILDVGTGSGLIALMLAQRQPLAQIEGLDIDQGACEQATINFADSPFATRLQAFQMDFRHFEPSKKYDLIVSNPPFFVDSMVSPDVARTLARHNDTLGFETLIRKSSESLTENGSLSLILPYDSWALIEQLAQKYNLFLKRKTTVCPKKQNPPKRILLEYAMKPSDCLETNFFIEQSRHVYSNEYFQLTKDFYLDK